jgi:hypothetical protein
MKRLPILLLAVALSACTGSQPAAAPSPTGVSRDFANRSICLAFRSDPKPDNPALIRADSEYGEQGSPALHEAVQAFLAAHVPNYLEMDNPTIFKAWSDALGRMTSTCAALIGP